MILNCYTTTAFTLLIIFLQSNTCQVTTINSRVIKSNNILTSANKLTEIHDSRVELVHVTDTFNETIENSGELGITSNGTDQNNTSISSDPIGTKWCGAGNVADSYDDLGSQRETDACCRAHDFCPDYIEAGESKHNLTNDAFYTRLSCKCDEVFRQCLRATKRRTASNIGTFYFNLLGTKCFRNEYPTVNCVRRGGWLKRKCLEYTYNTNASRYYQWFDVNDY